MNYVENVLAYELEKASRWLRDAQAERTHLESELAKAKDREAVCKQSIRQLEDFVIRHFGNQPQEFASDASDQ